MKAIKFSLIAGALLATVGAAQAQPAESGRGAEVTREQALARAEARFARLDANRDGSLTREEMRAGRQHQQAERQARRQAWIAQLPADQRARAEQRMAQRAERLAERTERRAERRARIQAMSPEQRAQHRAERQTNRGANRGEHRGPFANGGTLTLAEFRARALQRFERLDANRDGRVTVAERREQRQKLRQERRSRRG
jgi:Ca2+-binding EF-hand superfamily protein